MGKNSSRTQTGTLELQPYLFLSTAAYGPTPASADEAGMRGPVQSTLTPYLMLRSPTLNLPLQARHAFQLPRVSAPSYRSRPSVTSGRCAGSVRSVSDHGIASLPRGMMAVEDGVSKASPDQVSLSNSRQVPLSSRSLDGPCVPRSSQIREFAMYIREP